MVLPSTLTAGTVAKAAMPLVFAAAKAASSAAWKLYKSTYRVELPSQKDLQPVTVWLAEQIEATLAMQDEVIDSRLKSYLESPDFSVLMQHIFVFLFAGRDPVNSEPLRSEILRGLSNRGLTSAKEADALLRILCSTAAKITEQASVYDDELSSEVNSEAHTIMSTLYLESIDNQLRELLSLPTLDLSRIEEITATFSAAVIRKFGRIQPQSFDGVDPVPIDSLFVSPEVRRKDRSGSGEYEEALQLENITAIPRAVILGNPGGGKTTLTRKIASAIALGEVRLHGVDRQIVPFVIIIRDFGNYLQNEAGSIADYILEQSNSVYQIVMDRSTLDYLLMTGRIYIIFDGLDELLDTNYRKEIAEIIDTFAWAHPTANMLITSRKVGYSHNSMDPNVFSELSLGGFTENQVQSYVKKWFDLSPDLSLSQRDEISSNFMSESAHASDIRSNPLMLGLMCTIYKTESYIPRNRPEVYKKCSEMLFKTWDRSRGLFTPLPFEAHLEGVLASVAYKIYSSPNLQAGITDNQLSGLAADYLLQWAYEQRAEAEAAARDFFSFCKGRAWVLTEVGLDPAGEGLYQFSHRTFLEYFAGMHLARKHTDSSSLCSELLPGIVSGDLDVVAELAIQMNAVRVEGGPDRAVSALLSAAEDLTDWESKAALVIFTARSLSYLVPSPPVVRRVVALVVSSLFPYPIDGADTHAENEREDLDPESQRKDLEWLYLDAVTHFRSAARESRAQLVRDYADSVARLLSDVVDGTDTSIPLQEITAMAWSSPQGIGFNPFDDTEKTAEITQLRESALAVMRQHKDEWDWAKMALYYVDEIPIDDLLSKSPEIALHSLSSVPRARFDYVPASMESIRSFFTRALRDDADTEFDRGYKGVHRIAEYLRSRPEPTIHVFGTFNIVNNALMGALTVAKAGKPSGPELTQSELDDIAVLIAYLTPPEHFKRTRSSLREVSQHLEGPLKDLCGWFSLMMIGQSPTVAMPSEDPLVQMWAKATSDAVTDESELRPRKLAEPTKPRHRKKGSRSTKPTDLPQS
ncbi:NACHT domain-containing protein [Mycobacterium sp. C31M]